MDKEKIGRKLIALRGNKTQKEVADALGVTTMAVSQYERGARIPNDTIKIKIADYYHETVGSIFFE